MAKITPMMKQYLEIKQHHKDSILMFRLGDFYEMFADSDYDGDISDWDLGKAKHFSSMFYKANFTGKNGRW